MTATLKQLVESHDNDYSELERDYRRLTGSELVIDPYRSIHSTLPEIHLSVSVVIPAWNAARTLLHCLYAIEQSSFNRKYPNQLEVIVVDDGSSDTTWELLTQISYGFSLKAVRQANHGRSQARNTGIAIAEGDVIICCDADLQMTPFAIEEFMKRHQLLEKVLLLGFYSYLSIHDVPSRTLPHYYQRSLAPFLRDRRVAPFGTVWLENICRDSRHLKDIGNRKKFYRFYGTQFDLPSFVLGPLLSMRRRDFLAMGGFEEQIHEWGCEDKLLGARAIALGNYIIPVYSAGGFHLYHDLNKPHFLWRLHPERDQTWKKLGSTFQLYTSMLHAPFVRSSADCLDATTARIQSRLDYRPAPDHLPSPLDASFYTPYTQALAQPLNRAYYLMNVGRWQEAEELLATITGNPEAALERGKALRYLGQIREAVDVLEEVLKILPESENGYIELALALAADHQFTAAYKHLECAQKLNPKHTVVYYLLTVPPAQRIERARLFATHGNEDLALRDYEVALILQPDSLHIQIERAHLLTRVGKPQEADRACAAYRARFPELHLVSGADEIFAQAWNAAIIGQWGMTKVLMERLKRLTGSSSVITERLQEIHTYVAERAGCLLDRMLVETAQRVPGPFTADELEMLLVLTRQVLALRKQDIPVTLVDVGAFCGQATVILGLTLQRVQREGDQIVAVDGLPTEVVAEEKGRKDFALPLEIFLTQLHKHQLGTLVRYAEEQPYTFASDLLLISRASGRPDVLRVLEQYVSSLKRGGILAVHQYDRAHPDIQQLVHTLLERGTYQWIAEVDQLIVLKYQS